MDNTLRIIDDLSTALSCLGLLAGLGVGIFLIVRKRLLPGILAMAGFVLFSLGIVLNILAYRVFIQQIIQAEAYESVHIAISCINGISNVLACVALIAAFILLLKPNPAPPDYPSYPG